MLGHILFDIIFVSGHAVPKYRFKKNKNNEQSNNIIPTYEKR
jgi:hypothetical protein